MADIFISYSRQQDQLTRELARDLEKMGFTTWWDTNLLPGDEFPEEIKRQIDAAKAVIVIWTQSSVHSKWVRSEAARAEAQKKLITVCDEALNFDDIPLPFNTRQTEVVTKREKIFAALAGMQVAPTAILAEPNKEAEIDSSLKQVEADNIADYQPTFLSADQEPAHEASLRGALLELQDGLLSLRGALLDALPEIRWFVRLRGIMWVLFGIVTLIIPIAPVPVVLCGTFVLVDGMIALASSAFGSRYSYTPTGWLIPGGITGIAAGVIAFLWPSMSVIFTWALVRGVFDIIGGKELENEWTLIQAGVMSVLFGVVFLMFPIAPIWAMQAYAIVFGILLIGLSFRLRSCFRRLLLQLRRQPFSNWG